MVFINPLNIEELLVNQLAGSYYIFIMLAIFFIFVAAAKFRMTLGATLISVAAFIFLVYFSGMEGAIQPLVVVVTIIAAFIIGIVLVNRWKY